MLNFRRIWPLLGLLGLSGGLSACATAPLPAAPVAVLAPPKAVPLVVAVAPPVVAVAAPAADPAPELVAMAPAAVGTASWYRAGRRLHRTCSGAILDNDALTAASPTLPLGTTVRVARVDGGGSVVVLVNDRMPRGHRIIDVTEEAARDLGLMGSGVATVSVTPVMLADNQ